MARTRTGAVVPVPAEVLREIRSIHDAAGGKEFAVFAFVLCANRLGKTQAMAWVFENPFRYLQGVRNGFVDEP